MPSKSKAQQRLMQAVAHSPEFAAKVGIPQSVGQEFNDADKGADILRRAADKMKHPFRKQRLRIGNKSYG
jgi:hypothetical protein